MTDTPSEALAIPTDASRSRLHRENAADREPDAHVEDYTTADERLATFWRKYKEADVEFESESIRVDKVGGQVEWTVHVTVRICCNGDGRVVTGSATRSSTDMNDIVAHNPHETAQTAALSRALRFLGIKLQTRANRP